MLSIFLRKVVLFSANIQPHITADEIQAYPKATLPCAACHGTAYVGTFSGKIVPVGQMCIPKIYIFSFLDDFWLSWTNTITNPETL